MRSIAIVGASLAGLSAARTLRQEGFGGHLLIYGEEPHLPYDRPPLTKEILRGDWDPAQADLRHDDPPLEAEWRLGCRAVGLAADQRRLRFDDGSERIFDGIVLAMGATPRMLGAEQLRGVYPIRSLEDAIAVRAELKRRPQNIVIVGAGFIGQEVAASCRKLGLRVTMIESLAPAQHALGHDVGMRLAEIHREEGVIVRLGVAVAAIKGTDRVERVHLSDNSNIPADLVIVGIGVIPNTQWLEDSGLSIENGVICDETCLAAPGVVAAGDIARWPNKRYGELRRVEHWDNAIRQGQHAARRLLALDGTTAAKVGYEPVPWFWSDQYGMKIQLVGSTFGHEEVRIVDHATDRRRFVALYRRGDRLTAAFGLNSVGRIVKYRQELDAKPSWEDVTGAL